MATFIKVGDLDFIDRSRLKAAAYQLNRTAVDVLGLLSEPDVSFNATMLIREIREGVGAIERVVEEME